MRKRLVCLLLTLCMLFPLMAAGEETAEKTENGEMEQFLPFEGTIPVLENEWLTLYFTPDYNGLCVQDHRNGRQWYSQVQKSQIPEGTRVNKTWAKRGQSLFLLNYTDVQAATGNVVMTDTVAGEPVKTTEIQNEAFRLTFDFETLGLKLALEFRLEEDSLLVTIPFDSIEERDVNVITRVALLPFLGSANDWEDGYILYPNGCGELYRFKEEKYRTNALSTFTLPVYSPHITQAAGFPLGVETDMNVDSSAFVANLPAFGLKKGDAAMAAVIEAGDEDSDIVVNPGGVSLPVNNAYVNLVYRNNYGTRGQQINVGGSTELSYVSLLTDREIRSGDRKVRYVFLTEKDADYSGMARAVRKSYQERGILTRLEDAPDVCLDVFCTVEQQQVLTKEMLTFTTFAQARQMVEWFLEQGYDLTVNVKGWGSKGILGYPVYTPAAASSGGEKELAELAEFCAEHQVGLKLQVNPVKLKEGNDGFLPLTNAARDGNDYIYSIAVGKKTYYLQNHAFATEQLKKLRAYQQRTGASGLTFEDLGSYLFDDFAGGTLMRSDYVDLWQNALTEEDALIGGNGCMLGTVSLLREIPEQSSLISLGDESVPFYQMVVHGSVAYTGQPVNLFYDDVGQLLKMVEYGYTPCFELTGEGVSRLSSTDYQMLFSARFDTWKDEIADYAADFIEWSEQIGTRSFTEHRQLSANVYESVFEDVRVLVNYGSEEEMGVPAGGWRLVKEGKNNE